MSPKLTLQGLMILSAMGLYGLAFLLAIARVRGAAWITYAAGFVSAAAAWGYRWAHAEHVPLQSMFEVFLTLGLVLPPMTLLSRRLLNVRYSAVDMLLAAVILFPAAFVERFAEEPTPLPPALQSPLFIPHVAVYMLAYVILAKAGILGWLYLKIASWAWLLRRAGRGGALAERLTARRPELEESVYRLIGLGFPLLTAGLVLGAWWGKLAWGDWWNWDPKEMWSLATWLVYAAYFHVRWLWGRRHSWVNCLLAVYGLAAIVITLLLVTYLLPGRHSYAG